MGFLIFTRKVIEGIGIMAVKFRVIELYDRKRIRLEKDKVTNPHLDQRLK